MEIKSCTLQNRILIGGSPQRAQRDYEGFGCLCGSAREMQRVDRLRGSVSPWLRVRFRLGTLPPLVAVPGSAP